MSFWDNLVITNGTFRNGVHKGHVDFFNKINKIGRTITFVDSKERVAQIKPGAFCLDDETRDAVISGFCDQMFLTDNSIFNSDDELRRKIGGAWKMFKMNKKIDCNLIYAKGGDYKEEDLTLKPFIESLGGKIVIIPFLEGYSTSAIIKEIKEKNLT